MSALGVKRTCRFALQMSAYDPKGTWRCSAKCQLPSCAKLARKHDGESQIRLGDAELWLPAIHCFHLTLVSRLLPAHRADLASPWLRASRKLAQPFCLIAEMLPLSMRS